MVPSAGTFFDTGTPADYLAANLHAAGGGNLVDPTATVTGRCAVGGRRGRGGPRRRSTAAVVWPGARRRRAANG